MTKGAGKTEFLPRLIQARTDSKSAQWDMVLDRNSAPVRTHVRYYGTSTKGGQSKKFVSHQDLASRAAGEGGN